MYLALQFYDQKTIEALKRNNVDVLFGEEDTLHDNNAKK